VEIPDRASVIDRDALPAPDDAPHHCSGIGEATILLAGDTLDDGPRRRLDTIALCPPDAPGSPANHVQHVGASLLAAPRRRWLTCLLSAAPHGATKVLSY